LAARCEEHIVKFGEEQEKLLVNSLKKKTISVGLDELFRGRRPCLVAIEMVSGYILLEKFTEDRKAETWKTSLTPRLDALNVQVDQVVSDLSTGIRSYAKSIGAQHSPELFHAQYEISKATSAPFAFQEKEFERIVAKESLKLKKIECKYGKNSSQATTAHSQLAIRRLGLKQRSD